MRGIDIQAQLHQIKAEKEKILGTPANTMTTTIAMWRNGIPLVTISNVIICLLFYISGGKIKGTVGHFSSAYVKKRMKAGFYGMIVTMTK